MSFIKKSQQPSLEKLDFSDCPISGKILFDSMKNIGWENLKELKMGSNQINKEEVCIGLSNLCQYYFPNLTKLQICKLIFTKKILN